MSKKLNRLYSLNNKREYMAVLNKHVRYLKQNQADSTIYKRVAADLVERIRKLDPVQASFLPVVSKEMKNTMLGNFTVNIGTIVKGRFLRTIKDMWEEIYRLGKKHSVMDMLMNSGLFNKAFTDKVSFSSIEGVKLTDMIADEPNIATFADREDLTPAQRKAIARAKRNLTILRNNVNRLKAEGVLYRNFSLEDSSGKAARLTIEERIRFLEMIQQIDDFLKRAEASESTFLSNEYLKRRYRVLSDDYESMYDDYIKQQISVYLDRNIEGVRQIVSTESKVERLIDTIANELVGVEVDFTPPYKKAAMILRTELSIAYNFGKLFGFTSPTDLDRKFMWNADWELETKSDYQVCPSCAVMDGRVYTVGDLLNVGIRIDRGILRYEGKSRTNFKNPTMPMIPFHPNCSCYWTLMPEDDPAEDYAQRYVDTTIPPPSPTVLETTEQVNNLADKTIPIALGTGLIVGGLFLLARSNVWRLFYKTVVDKADDVIRSTPTQQVIDTTKFIQKEATDQVTERYEEILELTLRTKPEQLPTTTPPLSTIR